MKALAGFSTRKRAAVKLRLWRASASCGCKSPGRPFLLGKELVSVCNLQLGKNKFGVAPKLKMPGASSNFDGPGAAQLNAELGEHTVHVPVDVC